MRLAIVVLFPATASARDTLSGHVRAGRAPLQHELGLHNYLPATYRPGCYDYRTSQAVMAYPGLGRAARATAWPDRSPRRA